MILLHTVVVVVVWYSRNKQINKYLINNHSKAVFRLVRPQEVYRLLSVPAEAEVAADIGDGKDDGWYPSGKVPDLMDCVGWAYCTYVEECGGVGAAVAVGVQDWFYLKEIVEFKMKEVERKLIPRGR